jgi:glycerol-3-phosphate O-acyltransferase
MPPDSPAEPPSESPQATPGDRLREREIQSADPLSAMTPRFGWFLRRFAERFFRHFGLDAETVERLRELERRGTVVYVMRYASRLDYFLFNFLFLREGLRLSSFANGIRFWYYRPVIDALRTLWQRPRGVAQDVDLVRARDYSNELTRRRASFFLFLRTASLRSQLRGRKGAIRAGKSERDLLAEVVSAAWESDHEVHLVPLALFWRKGPRSRQRFLNLSYGATNRPSDLSKVTSFLTTYRGLHVKVGDAIDVCSYAEVRREDGPSVAARVLRRIILTFLYREERVVEGPVLQPRYRVQEIVIRNPAVQDAIRQRAEERGISVERAQLQAEKMFREISANMSSSVLALLDGMLGLILDRLFTKIKVMGISKVTDYAKRNAVVLVPSHRSYFDFLIISVLFYRRHIIPPHIAARENMSFGPFGFLFRRAGAFFLRKSFDDALYKAIFRTYVTHLIKQGFTQEFFIEGGRSRTGKTLAPRLGMLSWDVEAFLQSGRRDLFFVPIAITYERLVEEGAMVGELEGEKKQDESMLGLMRARKFLRRRFGSVVVNFGEPISLDAALGDKRERFTEPCSSEEQAERRDFIEQIGHRIVERINWAVVPSATAVAACALLGDQRQGLFRDELASRMQSVVDLLRLQDVQLTPELRHDEGAFHESISAMLRMDLIREVQDPRGDILHFDPSRRRALDLYRNSILHFLVAPSFLARRLLVGASLTDLQRDLELWLDLFYREFFTARGEVLGTHLQAYLDHFESSGFLERSDGVLRSKEKGLPYFRFLADQTRAVVEAYYAVFCAALAAPGPLSRKGLRKVAQEHFSRAQLLGEVGLPEAANPVTFDNAVDYLIREGMLAEAETPQDRREATFGPGRAWDELQVLRDRLAAALAPR